MSWLPNSSFLTNRHNSLTSFSKTEEKCDPTACFDSFKEHWLQVLKIIQRSQQLPSPDDILGVVNHLEQMVTLVLYDVSKQENLAMPINTNSTPCLEYLLSENVLSKLYDWSICTGRFENAMRMEQLKLYELLISQSRHQLLVHEQFLRPLLELLMSCQGSVFSTDVEKRLVILLNQLCVLLMQNIDLLNLFFCSTIQDHGKKFIIFTLLIPFIHRDGAIGMQARDALLLCMSLSKKNKNIGVYIAEHSNICDLLASGLSGLYSVLPHTLDDIESEDWHRFTPDDVNDIKDLEAFTNSLEFSNAVAQVAHPMIKQQLHEFLYRGFLIPVMGPALLQNNIEEQIAATAYLELMLRSVTEPGLLLSFVKFLLNEIYDGNRILDILINRAKGNIKQSIISLALFETLINLYCEDIMLEMVFQYLQPCIHIMTSQRQLLNDIDPYCQNVEKFLLLTPVCCTSRITNDYNSQDRMPRLSNVEHPGLPGIVNWCHYGNQLTESLYGNYHAYLCDARSKIATCKIACTQWTNKYDGHDSHKNNAETKFHLVPSEIEGNKTQDDGSEFIYNGLFLNVLFDKLENMLINNVYVNLHITGLFSRLATYPHPLLRTYLLNHKLILQPNVKSLFQVIGSLKQKIDDFMCKQIDASQEISQARWFLVEREIKMFNARKRMVENSFSSSITNNLVNDNFRRDEPKRKSLTSSFFSMFKRSSFNENTNNILTLSREDESYNSLNSNYSVWYKEQSEIKNYALCAVILEEWLKELAAISQEHTVAQLTSVLK